MKDLKTLTKDVERDLVINIVIGVRHGRLSMKEAKVISRKFMASFPFGDYEQLFETLYVLSNKFRVVRKVYIKYFPNYENEEREKILINMRNFMKVNDFENAVKTAKGGNYG